MKKLLLLLTIGTVMSLLLFSCGAEPIEMRTINPANGFDITGHQIMNVQNNKVVITPANEVTLSYKPLAKYIFVDFVGYLVINVEAESISYSRDGKIHIIQFNTGYIYNGGDTQTKFAMYQENNKQAYMDVYVYNN